MAETDTAKPAEEVKASKPEKAHEPKTDAVKALKKDGITHIRFVGDGEDGENSVCVVFGKSFQRGKWVPLGNLDGGNPDKKALEEGQLNKLLGNPAFELGDGSDKPMPGQSNALEEAEAA